MTQAESHNPDYMNEWSNDANFFEAWLKRRLDPRSFRRAERVRPSRPGPQPDMVVPERCHLKTDDGPNDDLLLETGRNPVAVKEKH